ncbi:MAG: TAXI family TRAP transporter solute-binding subunit [Planctomycetota bacterium]|jgi:TRAP transporter TAXI family solute receptor
MRRKKIWIIVPIICAAIGMMLYLKFYRRKPGQWKHVKIATATQGGTYYLLGDELKGILERLPGKPIERVIAEPSAGAVKNIELLMDPNSTTNVAFVMKSALLQARRENPQAQQELRVLARLYMDVVQVVVRRDTNIETIDDFRKFFQEKKSRKIFIGPERSGTRMVTTQILKSIGFPEGNYTPDDATKFTEAADRLINGKLDAAFFMAGTPTQAVQKALESGECKLLPLDGHTREGLATDRGLGLVEKKIPANFYRNQGQAIETVAADVFIVCRKNLPKDLAFVILEALLDNITDLLLVHAKAQEIKLVEPFEPPEGFRLHPGAIEFRDKESSKLLIATGALNGKYYELGRKIQLLLEERGIRARVMQTDGSLENAELLNERPTIAIMQYDAALASRINKPGFVYHPALSDVNIPQVRDIYRIAALHEEKVHIVIRKAKLEDIEKQLEGEWKETATLSKLAEAMSKLPQEQLRVCLGPPNSASQVVARAILRHHGIESTSIRQSFLSVPDMVNRLQHEEIDMGFFVSYVPSQAMKTVLNAEKFRLLSLGAKQQVQMAGRVFTTSTIDHDTYGCQKQDDSPIRTLATQAVLVTTGSLPFDVKTITNAVCEGDAFLGIAGNTMAKHLPSLPLHPDAERHYKKAKLLPSDPRFDWLRATWTTLGCLVMITAGYKGLIMLRRSRTGNEIGRRILAIPLEAIARDSVGRLLEIRDEIQQRVRRRWWRLGELDKHRWRYLRDLIHDRIGEAKENLTRAFVAEIRNVAHDPELDKTTRKQHYRSIEARIWEFFQKAELDPSQQKLLCELLRETGESSNEVEQSQREKKPTGAVSSPVIELPPKPKSTPSAKDLRSANSALRPSSHE